MLDSIMVNVIFAVILSVVLVSCVSLIGILTLLMGKELSKKLLLILVSLSAGTLFGGAFLHLLPEAAEKAGFTLQISLLVLAGVIVFFVLEKFIHWHHCHHHSFVQEKHKHETHIAPLNIAGDALHNFLDGLVIAGAYLINVPLGIATTIAVIIHEVPQEIADFGVLLYSGLSKKKALLLNFMSATMAIIGAILGLVLGSKFDFFVAGLVPFAAGGFLYIAGSNLIPELQKEAQFKESLWHFVALVAGIALMYVITCLE